MTVPTVIAGRGAFTFKVCTRCGETKNIDEFGVMTANSRDGRQRWCSSCMAAKSKAWRAANPERRRATDKVWRAANPGYHARDKRMRNYGLADHDYQAMFAVQKGLCAICETRMRPPAVDHDHVTGEIRGLLCKPCNAGIGLLRDSLLLTGTATAYLSGCSL